MATQEQKGTKTHGCSWCGQEFPCVPRKKVEDTCDCHQHLFFTRTERDEEESALVEYFCDKECFDEALDDLYEDDDDNDPVWGYGKIKPKYYDEYGLDKNCQSEL